MAKELELQEVASVFYGFQFRGKFNPDPNGNYFVVQMKDIEDEKIDYAQLQKVYLKKIQPKYLLKKDDILLINRGKNNRAVLVEKEIENLIPAGNFFLIRQKKDSPVVPSFLYHFFNLSDIKDRISNNRLGNTLSMLRKQELTKVKIPIISEKKQKKLSQLFEVCALEKKLMKKLQIERELFIHTKLQNTINREASF
ncbi:MAG: restriction endonuclease subunit S [Planctomycetota bacterium]